MIATSSVFIFEFLGEELLPNYFKKEVVWKTSLGFGIQKIIWIDFQRWLWNVGKTLESDKNSYGIKFIELKINLG